MQIVHVNIRLLIIALLICVLTAAGNVNAQEVQTLYSDDVAHCKAPGLENLFSGFVCSYQEIVDEVMTKLYQAMVAYFQQPFFALVTIYLACMGTLFALGMTRFSTKEGMTVVFKIAIISAFAMHPEFTIDILYKGLIGFMRQTTDAVVAILAPQGSVTGIFEWMDEQLYNFISLQDDARKNDSCDNNLLGLMITLAVMMPPLFAMAMYMLFQLFMVLLRTVVGYLLAITGIMFLITLSPIYLSFAFFRFTGHYFEKWMTYLLGFSLQIFIVFSFIAVVLSLPFGEKLDGVMNTVRSYDKTAYHDGQRFEFDNWCTLCASESIGSLTQPDSCVGDAIAPTKLSVAGTTDFINWIGKEILILLVMAYLVDSVLKAAPDIAKFMATVMVAPSLGSAADPIGTLGRSADTFFKTLRDTDGGIDTRTSTAARRGVEVLTGRTGRR